GEERDSAFELVHFDDRCAHQRAIDRVEALQSRTCGGGWRIGRCAQRCTAWRRMPKLSGQFGVAGLEETDERALAKRAADRLHLGKFVASPEDVEKARRLPLRTPEYPEFVKD